MTLRLLFLFLLALLGFAAPASAKDNAVETSWRLLDYIAVDYPGAVSGGKVVSAPEYAEMREFSASVAQQLSVLPDKPAKPALLAKAHELGSAIEAKQPPATVAGLARSLNTELLRAYPVPLAPGRAPDLAEGQRLFEQNCSSCHGLNGDAKTPVAAQLDPPPIAFTDRERAAQRSPFALYQVIDQGLEGTAMASFSSLPTQDRWNLAFYASRFAYSPALAAQGKRLWESDPSLRALVPDLKALSGLSEQELAQRLGADKAPALIAYLRIHPEALGSSAGSLVMARQRLRESVQAYEAGDREKAKALALSAYLDGFEPLEASLATRNGDLLATVEQAMGELRSAIGSGKPAPEVAEKAAEIDALFGNVDEALSAGAGSAISAFVGALTILLREGLEALLIVVAMLAFLRKADRREMERPVHYGWAGALAAGVLTWWAATSLISVSGAGRELTEGFGSLFAAVVLLFVGIWMHGKAQAGQWQRYIRDKMTSALTGRSAWFLFLLAFVAVYREVFETILFYAAMAAQGHVEALVAGGAAGAAVLAAIAVAMLRYSQRLPIGKFFAFSSALVAVLAVVLAGKGVAALQEAGLVSISPADFVPRISMLGLFPTVQVVLAQLLTLAILLTGFWLNRRRSQAASAAAA